MAKIKLEVLDAHQGIIKAPDFCPYKRPYGDSMECMPWGIIPIDQRYGIHASVCKLCKICDFESILDESENPNVFSKVQVNLVVNGLLKNEEFLDSVMRQIRFLQKTDRSPLMVLLSFSFVEKLIKDTLEEVYWTDAITYFTQNTFEIHNIAGIPVYFSRKLVKTPIMVIGEIEWE